MSNEKARALVLAETIMSISNGRLPESESIFAAAATELQTQHFRIKELEKDLGNAKRLVSKIWDKHPEARGTIEEGTGTWMVFGQNVETGGVSAQRITQAADHIAQPIEMVAAPVVLPEPDAWAAVHFSGKRAGKIYTTCDTKEQIEAYIHQVHQSNDSITLRAEPIYMRAAAPQPQADGRDAQRYRWLIDYFISDRVDLDDAIVAAKTSEDIAKIIDAAIAAEKEHK